jgi:CRISPR-associated protein Csd1
MLHHLVRYAHEHELVAEPGFAPKNVRWAIVLDGNGSLLNVIELGQAGEKNNPGRRFARCPDMTQQEMVGGAGPNETRSHFLIETADVVAGYFKDNTHEKVREKAVRKHAFFLGLLLGASTVMPELHRCADALEDETILEEIRKKLVAGKAKTTDKVTIEFNGQFSVDSNSWYDWWRSYRSTLGKARTASQGLTMRCFVSGELLPPALGHSKIKGLSDVGGLKTGDALVSFDKDAFCSYGLQQSTNCAVSEEGMAAYVSSLNDIIRLHSRQLAGMRVAHWFARAVPAEEDILAYLEDPATDQQEVSAQHSASKLLEAIEKGECPPYMKLNRYYALTLSGCLGRVMVRDWMEGSFEELARSINAWFTDMQIINRDATALTRFYGIASIVESLLDERKPKQKYADWIKPLGDLPRHMWHAAISRDNAIPMRAVTIVLRKFNMLFSSGDFSTIMNGHEEMKKRITISLMYRRLGIIKIYLNRELRKKGDEPMETRLQKDYPSEAYQCGRLMAVYEAIQHDAIAKGDKTINSGVVQRYYSSASTKPRIAFSQLDRLCSHHLSKLIGNQSTEELGRIYKNILGEIYSKISADGLPAVFHLDKQMLFTMGYYHQWSALSWSRRPSGEHIISEVNDRVSDDIES